MKKLLLILLCFPGVALAQKTYVPDDNFENYLEAQGVGDGISLNDSVFTSISICPNPIIGKQSNISSSFFICLLIYCFIGNRSFGLNDY